MSAYVGQQLRQARQSQNLTLEQIARVTYIRVSYLEALESGQLERLPSPAQARGFLRTYAKHLNLTPEPLLAALDRGEPTSNRETPSPPPPAAPPPPAEETVFLEIGAALRQHRELLGLKLEDIEQQTRIRLHYLKALEEGNLSALPSPVQGRGMLSNYATFLGLDTDPLLLKFADGLQAGLKARRGPRATPTEPGNGTAPGKRKNPLRRYISNDLIFGGMLGAALLIFVIWGAIRVSTLTNAEQASPTAPALVDMLAPEVSPSPSATLGTPGAEASGETGEDATPTPGVLIPILNEDAVQLYLVVRQRAWMRITIDGEVEFEGRVIPGNAYSYSAQESIELLTGNGAALQVFYNQNDLGPLGLFGEVVQRTFTPNQIITPSPTVTPTPTITETPAESPTPEATGTETPTP
jgi:cytoskeletal protein RodZ